MPHVYLSTHGAFLHLRTVLALLPYIIEADEFEIFTFELVAFIAGWFLVIGGFAIDTLYGGEQILDLLVAFEGFECFAQGFYVDTRQGYVELLHGCNHLFTVKAGAIYVTTQGGYDGLLDGVQDL